MHTVQIIRIQVITEINKCDYPVLKSFNFKIFKTNKFIKRTDFKAVLHLQTNTQCIDRYVLFCYLIITNIFRIQGIK